MSRLEIVLDLFALTARKFSGRAFDPDPLEKFQNREALAYATAAA